MLDSPRYQRAKSIFFEACERSRESREAFVEGACAGDPDLHEAVLELLAHDANPLSVVSAGIGGMQAGSGQLRGHLERLADSSAGPGASTSDDSRDADGRSSSPRLPDRIGNYRILSRLGEGGMGVVYLAEQDNPRRQVALKVIAPGQTSRQMLRRFEHEAHILGRLHHPGIAQVYDAGTHDAGEGAQPYFAMELVRGRALLRHCEESRAELKERLRLFIAICEAVQHAHQQGVIHRDLKPANILVEEANAHPADGLTPVCRTPQPKILDFGVARLTDSDVQATTMHTAADQLIGTVAYMSPEQMSGKPEAIDTRSDVYALGVILFELLAGRLPHDIAGMTIPEMIRAVSEHDPSTLSSVSRVYRGDLETIVGKAMERDKTRRYQSAGEVGADVRRYLSDQPIHARPPSAMYQFRKFARRNKALVGGAIAVFLALSGGMITTAWQARQAIAARDKQIELRKEADDNAAAARDQADKSDTVVSFLRRMLSSADPHSNRGRDYTVRRLLDDFAQETGDAFAMRPDVRATVLQTMGAAYLSLGEFDQARPLLVEALDIRRQLNSNPPTQDLADALTQWGWWQHDTGDFVASEQSMREALAIRRQLATDVNDARVSYAMQSVGDVLRHQGRLDESIEILQEALRRLRATGDDDAMTSTLSNLAQALEDAGRPADAEPLLREAVALGTGDAGEPDVATAMTMGNLGYLLGQLGKYEEAERLLRQSVDCGRRQLGEEHPDVATRWNNLGMVLSDLDRAEEAEECYRRAIEIHRTHPEYRRMNLASMLQNLGISLASRSLGAEAVAALRESIDLTLADEQANPEDLASRRGILGELLWRDGRADEGMPLAIEGLEGARRVQGDEHPSTMIAAYRVGMMLVSQGRLDDAQPLLEKAFEVMMRVLGPAQRDTVQVAAALGELRLRQGRLAEAETCLLAVYQPAIDSLGENHPATARVLSLLLPAIGRQGRLPEADALVLGRIERLRPQLAPNDMYLADMIASVAISLHSQKRWSDAVPMLREGQSIMQANDSPQPMTAQLTWRLGSSLAELGNFDEGAPLLLEAFEIIRASVDIDAPEKRQACAAIISMYEKLNKPGQAAAWQGVLLQLQTPATQPNGG